MIEFEYQPWKKIVVHEVVKFPLEHFLSVSSVGVATGQVGRPLSWVDGIIYKIGHFRDTDDIIKEKIEGKLHWSHLHYAILKEYQPEFKVEGNIRIPVFDISGNEIFREMANWIKKNFEKT